MTNLYASLSAMRARLDVDSTSDDTAILQAIEDASRWIDKATGRHFYPKIATYYFDYECATSLGLGKYDLLSLTTLTTANGATAISSADYFIFLDGNYNEAPYNQISIDSSSTAAFSYTGTAQKSQTVLGVWGFHIDYDNAYTSTATLSAEQSSAATTASVANGLLFSAGQTILIGTEWEYVSAINGNVLTVKRAMNGSTAATHASAAAISIYHPIDDVVRATLRLALWLYKQNASPLSYEIQTNVDGTVVIPPEAPVDVLTFVAAYMHPILKAQKWQIFP